MAKNNYQLGQAQMGNDRRGGPGGRMNVAEKPKDMAGAIRNILRYLNKFIPQVSTALVCSVVSVMLTLFGPDQLSRITNLIEEGLGEGYARGHEDRDPGTGVLRLQRSADLDPELHAVQRVQIRHEGYAE